MSLESAFNRLVALALAALLLGFVLIMQRYRAAAPARTRGSGSLIEETGLPACEGSSRLVDELRGASSSDVPCTEKLRQELVNFMAAMQACLERRDDEHLNEKEKQNLHEFVAQINTVDVENAVKMLQICLVQNPTAAGINLQMQLLARWTEANPREALAWANETLGGRSRERILNNMAGVWARQNLPNAVSWVKQLPDDDERQRLLARVADEAVLVDPLTALSLARTLPSGFHRDDLIADAAGQWAEKWPGDASAWAAKIPDDVLKAKVNAAIAIGLATNDPAGAARLALGALPQGQLQNRTMLAIMERFADLDLPKARIWVAQLPNGDLRSGAEEVLREASAHSTNGVE